MNEELARELAVLQDEIEKLKPAVDHIKSASDTVTEAENVLSTYKENIEKLFIKVEKAFEEEIDKGNLMINELVKETRKTLADYSEEFERNVRKQADIGRDILKEADEVVKDARSVNESTRTMVDDLWAMKLSQKLLALIIIGSLTLILIIVTMVR